MRVVVRAVARVLETARMAVAKAVKAARAAVEMSIAVRSSE